MRKVITKNTPQADGSVLVENIIVASSLNKRTLNDKFGIREDGFLDRANEIELTISDPQIYVCNSSAIRKIVSATSGERVYVVRQIHQERFV